MSLNNKHITNNSDFFAKGNIPYSKSKDEIWDKLSTKIEEGNQKAKTETSKTISYKLIYSIAATLLVLLSTTLVMRYYNTTITCPTGNNISAILPDGSVVTINSNSTLTYYPLWWQLARNLTLTGEAFFEVEKGKPFNVTSTLGKTVVLGTSFNIFSRGNDYIVTCVTGKVKVISTSNNEVILSPNYLAELNKNGEIVVTKTQNIKNATSWIDGMFNFKSVPLIDVIDEIDNYYDVTITHKNPLDYSYTGFFSKEKPIEEVLTLFCKPFNLTFKKTSPVTYEIIETN